jgi:hypothetical protein
MSKKFVLAILALLVVTLVPTSPLFACQASCLNGSCSGTGTCSCVDGDPVCSDKQIESSADLTAVASYAKTFNTPGLNRFAAANEKIAEAMAAGDKDAYFLGVLEREDALKSLSPREQKILNSYHQDVNTNRGGARQK